MLSLSTHRSLADVAPPPALSTLDELKRAPNPLHDLAAEATRFLESQFNIANQISATLPTKPLGKGEADPRIRLRAQAASEEWTWAEVEGRWKVPEDYVPLLEGGKEELDEEGHPIPPRLPSPNDVPRNLRSAIQCVLYFLAPKSPTSNTTSLVVYNTSSTPYQPQPRISPPSLPSSNEPFRSNGTRPAPPPVDYLTRSSGDAIAYWCETFLQVPVQVARKEAVVMAREWAKAQAASKEARDRGRGRGGRGGGRGRGGGGGRSEEAPGRGRGKTLFVP